MKWILRVVFTVVICVGLLPANAVVGQHAPPVPTQLSAETIAPAIGVLPAIPTATVIKETQLSNSTPDLLEGVSVFDVPQATLLPEPNIGLVDSQSQPVVSWQQAPDEMAAAASSSEGVSVFDVPQAMLLPETPIELVDPQSQPVVSWQQAPDEMAAAASSSEGVSVFDVPQATLLPETPIELVDPQSQPVVSWQQAPDVSTSGN